MGIASSPNYATADIARVLGYDSETATVRVAVRGGSQPVNAQMITSMLTFGRDGDITPGAGVSAIPEKGSLAIMLKDGYGEWYVIGCISVYDGARGKYRALRKKRQEGDFAVNTRFGNAIEVLAGGYTNIQATTLTGTNYTPDQELIQNTCRNFVVDTQAGNLNWTVDPKSGKSSAVMKVNSSFEPESPQGILAMGNNRSGNVFEATVSTSPGSRFAINKQGVTRIESEKDINALAGKGNVRVNGRMIYLNSGSSGATPPSEFPENAVQVDPVTPSLPTPSSIFQAFVGFATSLGSPDAKRQLNDSTFSTQSAPLLTA